MAKPFLKVINNNNKVKPCENNGHGNGYHYDDTQLTTIYLLLLVHTDRSQRSLTKQKKKLCRLILIAVKRTLS